HSKGIMHRDVKPHNVMIDHENRKVSASHVLPVLWHRPNNGVIADRRTSLSLSSVLSIGVWRSSTTLEPSITYVWRVDTSRVPSYSSISKSTTTASIC